MGDPQASRVFAAVLLCGASCASLRFGGGGRVCRGRALSLFAPPGSGYVQPSADRLSSNFSTFPETYEPNTEYVGTCVPGTGLENRPFQDLTLEHSIAPHAFYEAPFHARWPGHHPYKLSPAERLEAAGRFVDEDDEQLPENQKRKVGKKRTTVEKIDVEDASAAAAAPAAAEEKDPLFDDSSSQLLDAALGLDDDDDDDEAAAAAPAAAGAEAAVPERAPEASVGDYLLD